MSLVWDKQKARESQQLLAMNAVGAVASMNHDYLIDFGHNPKELGIIKVP